MKEFIFLGGLARSGNTLLASLFMQHPKVAVTAHSNLINVLYRLNQLKEGSFHKNFPDDKSLDNILDNVVENYYSHWKENIIIDRSPWGTLENIKLIKKYIKPKEIKFLFLKRPFKEILASFYAMKKHDQIYGNLDFLMRFDQMIRFDYRSVGTVLQDPSIKTLIIEYEDLSKNPQKVVDEVCKFCNVETIKLNLNNLKQLQINGVKYNDKHVKAPLHKIETNFLKYKKPNYSKLFDKIFLDKYEQFKYLDKIWEKTPNFNFVESVSIKDIKILINVFLDKDWKEFKHRQKTFKVHEETLTIPIIYNINFDKNLKKKQGIEGVFNSFLGMLKNIFIERYGEGDIVRAILVKLPANKSIEAHQDFGESLENTRRYHLPIETNDKVLFTVGGETKNLKAGDIWEIKNTDKVHSVKNNGETDRVHLIVDWKSHVF